MAKLKPKPVVENEFDAIQWRGFIPTEGLNLDEVDGSLQHKLGNKIDYVLDFETWCKKHLKGKKIKYRGNNLVFTDHWGEAILTPGMWIVMIPEEPGEPAMPNFMTDEQVKSYYNETGL